MSDTSPSPVTGPFRITVESIPAGVTLDVEPLVTSILQDVVGLLLEDEFGDRLAEIADAEPVDPHTVLRPVDLPVDQLVADLVERVDTRMPVYGQQVLALANRLSLLSRPRPVPAQRKGGAVA